MRPASIAILGLVAVLGSCRGEREPPLVAGPGLSAAQNEGALSIGIDSSRVPLVDGCADGTAVVRRGAGWACERVVSTDPTALAGIEGSVSRATTELNGRLEADDQLDRRLADLEQAPFGYSVIACAVQDTDISRAQRYGGRLLIRAPGEVSAFCPVFSLRPRPTWTRLILLYRDPDGAATDAQVGADLRYVARGSNDFAIQSVEGAQINSDEIGVAGVNEATVTFQHDFDFEARSYFLQVKIATRMVTNPEASIAGFRLW